MKSPAFQFYPSDFTGSGKVGTMTTEEVGAYALLLCFDWNETGFVYDEEELARWCRLSRAKFRKVWVRVSRCFVERDGRLYNPRLEAERTKQAEWREKSRNGGLASGQARAKGGSTTLQRPTQPNTNTLSPSPSLTENGTTPPPPSATPRVPSVDVAAVLAHYRSTHPSRRPGGKDTKAVQRGLRSGYSVAELCDAITGNAEDPWHRERSKHELSYVLRDNGQIDTFRDRAAKGPVIAILSTNGVKPSAADQMAASMGRIFTSTPTEP